MNQILTPPSALTPIPNIVAKPEVKLEPFRPRFQMPKPGKGILSLGGLVSVMAVAAIVDVAVLIIILGNSLHWQLCYLY
ncbi:MAG TPA: hypothetical protein V6C69_21655 [Trichormus sp.]|jgi:hypothetical protein